MKLIFYTVLTDKAGFPVKYFALETYRRKTFSGQFNNPHVAAEEFIATIGGERSCYLDPDQFQKKGRALAKLRRELKQREQGQTH